jgi:hypothetical protein
MRRIRCKICGAVLKRDSVGFRCPTKNCQWQHGTDEVDAEAAAEKGGKMANPVRRRVVRTEVDTQMPGKTYWRAWLSCGHTKSVGGNYNQQSPPKTTRCEKCEAVRESEMKGTDDVESGREPCVNCGTLTEPELCLGCNAALCTPCSNTLHGLCEECREFDDVEDHV